MTATPRTILATLSLSLAIAACATPRPVPKEVVSACGADAFAPLEERPPDIPLSVVSRDGVLYLFAADAFTRVICQRYEEVIWEARCPNGPACAGGFVYGDRSLLTSVKAAPLREGVFTCNVFRTEDWDDGSGSVAFCLNGSSEIGACRRD